ncbi:MAG TPA: RNA polymerase sigma factor FliA [Steroidobacteraceae bacterium]|nr:RNA polymerase sigma factor FliA [Steroidobacteraceae bacterium]
MNAVNRYAAPAAAGAGGEELILRHAELVKRIAYHLAGRLPPSVAVDDLIQAGMLGLMEAAANWSMNRGASFETYAGIRIRGAMIDALRKLDWAPRSVHRRARAVAAAVRAIEQRSGRDARDTEVADELGLSLEDYHRVLQDAACCQLASLEEASDDAAVEDADPFRDAADAQFREALSEAIAQLPDRERLVMSLYYSDGLNLKEIGAVLEVSESRACQLHGQALTRLRARLTDWRDAPARSG